MSLVATDNGSGGDFTPAPQGTHTARCVRVIDLGTQPGSQMYPAPRHKVLVGWELPEEMREYDGKQEPAMVFKRYTMSLNEKARLRHDLESWRGRNFTEEELAGFHLRNISGVPCMVTITHSDDKKYANINAVTSLPKSVTVPPAFNDVVYYEIEDGPNEMFQAMSEKLQATIRSAPEWCGGNDPDCAPGSEDGDPGFDDDSISF